MTPNNTLISKVYDALVVGGGPAGLATATALSRQLYTSVVFDSGLYRNARATNMHNVLGFDHVPPAEFRAKAREDIRARYAESVSLIDAQVLQMAQVKPGLFSATDAQGKQWYGRTIVLATGVTDLMPDIAGYAECWGRVIFHCLFCHGFEERNAARVGVLAFGMLGNLKMALHIAYMARPLGKRVTIYTHGNKELAEEVIKNNNNEAFNIDSRTITRMRFAGADEHAGITLTFDDGQEATERFVAHAPYTKANGPFAQQLGLDLTDNGDIRTTPPFGQTSLPGVYAAGDCANVIKAVAPAASSGVLCAAGMVVPLQTQPNVELPPGSV